MKIVTEYCAEQTCWHREPLPGGGGSGLGLAERTAGGHPQIRSSHPVLTTVGPL